MDRFFTTMKTPIGELVLTSDGKGLSGIYNDAHRKFRQAQKGERKPGLFKTAVKQLREYFAGKRKKFSVPLSRKGTVFQHSVWKQLQAIPYGQTRSYGEIAKKIKAPKASRAVGMANGKNPVCIIVPCHRVIGANGKLTGFAGGLKMKTWLLKHEGIF